MRYKEYDHDLARLENLSHWELEDHSQDIRGRPLMTSSGERLGYIEDMLVDRDEERVAAVRLRDGRALPVEPLEIRNEVVILHLDPDPRDLGASEQSSAMERVPVVEEKLVVGKREVNRGGIRVRKRVVEEPVSKDVRLRTERVTVERTKETRPADDPERVFREKTVEVTERAEEPVVEKKAFVTDEVVVRKGVDQRVEQLTDTVRETKVDVDKVGGRR